MDIPYDLLCNIFKRLPISLRLSLHVKPNTLELTNVHELEEVLTKRTLVDSTPYRLSHAYVRVRPGLKLPACIVWDNDANEFVAFYRGKYDANFMQVAKLEQPATGYVEFWTAVDSRDTSYADAELFRIANLAHGIDWKVNKRGDYPYKIRGHKTPTGPMKQSLADWMSASLRRL
jgi:hypothetical protein